MSTDNKHIEDLLKPRYKVIADYPGNPFGINQVLTLDQIEKKMYNPEHMMTSYPHLFRELQWWEEREEKDMPMYVTVRGEVYKVKEWDMGMVTPVEVFINPKIHKGYIDSCTDCPLYGDILPATEKQYNDYIQKQKS